MENQKHNIETVGMARNEDWEAPEKMVTLLGEEKAKKYRKGWGELFIKSCRQKTAKEGEMVIETIEDFCEVNCIGRDTLLRWSKIDPEFAMYYKQGKMLLANKDFKGIKHKIFEPSQTARHLHTLDDKWEAIDKYHADLKKTEEVKGTGTIIAEITGVRSFEDKKEVKC